MANRSESTNDGKEGRGNVCIVSRATYRSGGRRQAEALVGDGFDVHVVCLRDRGEAARERVDGVEVHRLSPARAGTGRRWLVLCLFDQALFFLLAFVKLSYLDVKLRFLAVQVDAPPDCLIFTALMPKLAGAKLVLYLKAPTPEVVGSLVGGGYGRIMMVLLGGAARLSVWFADWVVTTTREVRDHLGRRGMDVNDISVVVGVADDRIYRLDRFDYMTDWITRARRQERRAGRFRIVCQGAIEEREGVDVLIKALARLEDDIPGIDVCFIGRGDYRRTAEQLAKELKVERRVSFVEAPSFEARIESILTSDVAVIPTRKTPLSTLVHPDSLYQYVALKRPVVASRLDSVAAYFPDGSIVYFDPGDDADLADKLRWVFAHPETVEGQVERCSRVYETYRWEREELKYLGVYRSLLST